MNPKIFVSVVTDKKLGKAPTMCLGQFWLRGIMREIIVAMEILAHTKCASERLDGLHGLAMRGLVLLMSSPIARRCASFVSAFLPGHIQAGEWALLLGVVEAIHDNVSVSRLLLGSDCRDFEAEVQQRHLCHPLCEWPICEDNQFASMAIANVV